MQSHLKLEQTNLDTTYFRIVPKKTIIFHFSLIIPFLVVIILHCGKEH